jgi:hypothetical protein
MRREKIERERNERERIIVLVLDVMWWSFFSSDESISL